MRIEALALQEVKLLTPKIFRDERGFFSETYNRKALVAVGIDRTFVQDNQSLSRTKGVLRGLHFQIAPHPQGKLVRVTRGAIFDVAVDIRQGSPSFGRHVSAMLSADNWSQLWVPEGFAHGFCTLEPDTEVIYKVTDFYAPECERGLGVGRSRSRHRLARFPGPRRFFRTRIAGIHACRSAGALSPTSLTIRAARPGYGARPMAGSLGDFAHCRRSRSHRPMRDMVPKLRRRPD